MFSKWERKPYFKFSSRRSQLLNLATLNRFYHCLTNIELLAFFFGKKNLFFIFTINMTSFWKWLDKLNLWMISIQNLRGFYYLSFEGKKVLRRKSFQKSKNYRISFKLERNSSSRLEPWKSSEKTLDLSLELEKKVVEIVLNLEKL